MKKQEKSIVKTKMIMGLIVLVAVSFISALPVMADTKTYPGSMGAVYRGSPAPDYYYSAIANPSTSRWLYLDLPIINDKHTGIRKGWVHAVDLNRTNDIRCTLTGIYRSGHRWIYRTGGTKKTTGLGSAAQRLYFGGFTASSLYHFYYSCRIPPKTANGRSFIISYNVTER